MNMIDHVPNNAVAVSIVLTSTFIAATPRFFSVVTRFINPIHHFFDQPLFIVNKWIYKKKKNTISI